jgi:hypothetical protein
MASTLPLHSPETSHGVLLQGKAAATSAYPLRGEPDQLQYYTTAMHLFICYPTVHDTLLSLLAFARPKSWPNKQLFVHSLLCILTIFYAAAAPVGVFCFYGRPRTGDIMDSLCLELARGWIHW